MRFIFGRLHMEEGKQGLGTAYVHGFTWALEKGYECIFEMDADFSHNNGAPQPAESLQG